MRRTSSRCSLTSDLYPLSSWIDLSILNSVGRILLISASKQRSEQKKKISHDDILPSCVRPYCEWKVRGGPPQWTHLVRSKRIRSRTSLFRARFYLFAGYS